MRAPSSCCKIGVPHIASIETETCLSLRASTDTVVANLAQQGAGLLLVIALPNLLTPAQFAVLVTAGVVLSFARFPDLGLSMVYGRDMPGHVGAGNRRVVESWDRSLLWFSALAGSAVGVAAGAVFLSTGAPLEQAILLALVPPLMAVSSAYVSFATVRGDFRRYRDAQLLLACGRLLSIPLVFATSVSGWFIAQVLGAAAAFAGRGSGWMPRPVRIDWPLVGKNLPASLQLAAITLLWFQLLDSARLFAVVYDDAGSIAAYGIMVAAYQFAYGLVISAYLPVTVNTLRLLGSDEAAAIAYVQRVIGRTLPWVFVLTVAAAEFAPWVLRFVFPGYAIDAVLPRFMIYGLSAMPVLATVGTLFIGKRRNGLYFLMLIAAFGAAAAADAILRQRIGAPAAVYAQLMGTFALAGMLLVAGRTLFAGAPAQGWSAWWTPALWLCALWGAYFVVRQLFVGQAF